MILKLGIWLEGLWFTGVRVFDGLVFGFLKPEALRAGNACCPWKACRFLRLGRSSFQQYSVVYYILYYCIMV